MDQTKNSVKLTFYPMAGSIGEQYQNLVETLKWIESNKPNSNEVYEWLRKTYALSHYFAKDVYTVILVSSGLISVSSGRCHLTTDGRAFLSAKSPILLLEIFEKRFAGVAAFLEVLRNQAKINGETLKATWFEVVKDRFPRMKDWSKRTLNNQCGHRINWLRAMGLISVENGKYSLSDLGWQFVLTKPPESIAIQRHEIQKQERRLRELALGKFNAFDPAVEKTHSMRESFVRDRAFRKIVTSQYDHSCAVCELRLVTPKGVYEAEAAHIVPKEKMGSDDPRNGLSLCGTHHWTFDEGLISIDPTNHTLLTASYLKSFSNEESVLKILKLRDKHIKKVLHPEFAPSVEALDWHNQNVFLG